MKLKIKNVRKAPFYFNETQKGFPIDSLLLSTRSSNALHRNKIETIGQLMDAIEHGTLDKINNLGIKSRQEVKCALIKYQLILLPTEERKDEYIAQLLRMNRPELIEY